MNPVQILIYGTIGGELLSADICKAVLAAGESPIVARINSPGGSVFEAYAIYNAFAAHKPGVEVVIDGIAASAASYIAMAGKPVKMAANAMFMAHNPSSWEGGDSEALRKQADLLDKVKASLVSAYAAKTGRSPEEIAAELDNDEFIDAETAKARGYVDEIFDPMEMAAKFDFKAFKNQPKITALRSFTADLRAAEELLTATAKERDELKTLTKDINAALEKKAAEVTALADEKKTALATVATFTATLKNSLQLTDAQLAEIPAGKPEPIATAVTALADKKALAIAAAQGAQPLPTEPSAATRADEIKAQFAEAAKINDPVAKAKFLKKVSASIARGPHGNN